MRIRRLLGAVFLVVILALPALSIAVYRDVFSTLVPVTLRTDHTGNQLLVASDVKVRGLIVGEVRRITSQGDGAELELGVRPDQLSQIPANVSARLLPKTLFGERYVALVEPQDPAPEPLSSGAVIGQDRSSTAIELERVLANVMPTLQALQPQKLSSTLTAMSQALSGRGKQLGQTLVGLDSYLRELNPQLPKLTEGLGRLATVSDAYNQAAPDLVQALNDLVVTSKTIAEQKTNLDKVYQSLTATSQDANDFLEANKRTLIRVSEASRPTLELLARYSPSYPCVLESLTKMKPLLDKAFGKGTDQPGLRAVVSVTSSRGAYEPGKDAPVYNESSGPQCIPYGQPSAVGDLGLPNSAQDSAMVAALAAPAMGVAPQAVPSWSSVLLGPLYRGAEVTVK